MTDITELAQSLKAAAEKATPGPWGVVRDGKTLVSNQSHPIATVSDAMHRMLADGSTGKDAEFIALANPANIRALVEALEKAQETIAFQQREIKALLSSLESRTVKLPDLRQIVSGDRYVWSDGVYNYSQDVKVVLAAAGIKVEAE
ncbi:TPA: ead/Ea22-like family protein [Klebsiella michiganensis]|nr:ead/Ea22-like family protein [Klebsiella michiganensis]